MRFEDISRSVGIGLALSEKKFDFYPIGAEAHPQPQGMMIPKIHCYSVFPLIFHFHGYKNLIFILKYYTVSIYPTFMIFNWLNVVITKIFNSG